MDGKINIKKMSKSIMELETERKEDRKYLKILVFVGLVFYLVVIAYILYVISLTHIIERQPQILRVTLINILITLGVAFVISVGQVGLFYLKSTDEFRKKTYFFKGFLKLCATNLLIAVDLCIIVNELFKNSIVMVPEGLMIRTIENIPMGFFMIYNAYLDMRTVYWAISDLEMFGKLSRGQIPLRQELYYNKSICGWLGFIITAISFMVIYAVDSIFDFNGFRVAILGVSFVLILAVIRVVKKRYRIVIVG